MIYLNINESQSDVKLPDSELDKAIKMISDALKSGKSEYVCFEWMPVDVPADFDDDMGLD